MKVSKLIELAPGRKVEVFAEKEIIDVTLKVDGEEITLGKKLSKDAWVIAHVGKKAFRGTLRKGGKSHPEAVGEINGVVTIPLRKESWEKLSAAQEAAIEEVVRGTPEIPVDQLFSEEKARAALVAHLKAKGKILLKQIDALPDGWGEGGHVYLLEDEHGNQGTSDLWRSVYGYGVIAVAPEKWAEMQESVSSYAARQTQISEDEARAEAREKEINAENRAKEEKEKAALAEAAATGKKVAIRSYTTTECMNGHDSECSCDHATVYAMPDGTIKTKYVCTF